MTVVVRWAPVDGIDADDRYEWLSPAEWSRRQAMRRIEDRRHFVGARLLLRQTVVETTGAEFDDIALVQSCPRCGGAHGRPSITIRGSTGPHVSMAHAGGFVIVAVANRPVGVDLEPTNASPELRTWVRTEAILKATGHGLDVDPSLIRVSGPAAPPTLERWCGPGRTPALRMADLDVGDDLVAGVARLGRRRLRIDAAAVGLDARAGVRGRATRPT